jgi:5-methyltetrahydropteroyltriglutamate--homocysteine methyltransferase
MSTVSDAAMAPATLYRADQVGSLLRPPELLWARAAHGAGQLGVDGLRVLEDRAILRALDRQRAVGIDVLTDGEYRRASFMGSMVEATEGFVPADDTGPDWQGPGVHGPSGFRYTIGAQLRQTRRLTAHETAFLRAHAPGPFKVTLPSPNLFVSGAHPAEGSARGYPTRSDLLRDLTEIVRGEVRALSEEGVPYIQVDAPMYAHYREAEWRARTRAAGLDPEQVLDEAIAADNACLAAGRREGVILAVHMCRGASRSGWLWSDEDDAMGEKLFNGLEADRFLIEYDVERAGGFEPLRFVPPGRTVVLGLVSTKQGALESPELLVRRVAEAARHLSPERLALSPQCGFASIAVGNPMSMDDQWRKLELVAETARQVWS